MQNIENSVVSKSASSVTNNQYRDLLVGRQQKIDILFPLFDQMNTIAQLPNFICFLLMIYVFFQLVFVTAWFKSRFYDNSSELSLSIVPIFLEVLWFTNTRDYHGSMVTNLIIVLVFSVLTFSWICFQIPLSVFLFPVKEDIRFLYFFVRIISL